MVLGYTGDMPGQTVWPERIIRQIALAGAYPSVNARGDKEGLMSRWFTRVLAGAVVTVVIVTFWAFVDLGLRQLRYQNCLALLRTLEVARVTRPDPARYGPYARAYQGLDSLGRQRFDLVYLYCNTCLDRVERWPR